MSSSSRTRRFACWSTASLVNSCRASSVSPLEPTSTSRSVPSRSMWPPTSSTQVVISPSTSKASRSPSRKSPARSVSASTIAGSTGSSRYVRRRGLTELDGSAPTESGAADVAVDDPIGAVGKEAAVASLPSEAPLPTRSEAAEEGCAAEDGWAAAVPLAAGPSLVEGTTVVSGMSLEALGPSSPALAAEPVVELAPAADSRLDEGAALREFELSGASVRLEAFGTRVVVDAAAGMPSEPASNPGPASVVEATAESGSEVDASESGPEAEDASGSELEVEYAAKPGPGVDGGAGDAEGLGVAYGAAEGLEVATPASDAEPVASSARASLAGAASEASRGAEDWTPVAVGAGADASVDASGTSVDATGALVADPGETWSATSGRGVTRTRAGVPM